MHATRQARGRWDDVHLAVIAAQRRHRRFVAHTLRRLGVRVTEADSLAVLAVRKFTAIIALESLSQEEVRELHRRQLIVVDTSGVGQNAAIDLVMRAASLARARKLMSTRSMVGEGRARGDRLHILLLEDHVGLRTTLARLFRLEANRSERSIELAEARQPIEALTLARHVAFDVIVTDACLGDMGDRSGLAFLKQVRSEGFGGRAFILTATRDYAVEAAADALGARYVPKENLDAHDLVTRVLGCSITPKDTPSSVRLKRVSREDVVSYLAHEPDGLHAALARARADVVRAVVDECDGNRTAAARRLRISRQQVQAILDELERLEALAQNH